MAIFDKREYRGNGIVFPDLHYAYVCTRAKARAQILDDGVLLPWAACLHTVHTQEADMAFHGPARMVWRLVRKRCEIQAWYDGGDRARITGNGLSSCPGPGRDESWHRSNRSSVHTEQRCGPRAIDSRTAYPKCRKLSPEQRKVMTAVQLRTCILSRQRGRAAKAVLYLAAAAASSSSVITPEAG